MNKYFFLAIFLASSCIGAQQNTISSLSIVDKKNGGKIHQFLMTNPGTDLVVKTIGACNAREPRKYLPRYVVTLVSTGPDKSTYLVSGIFIKKDGITYKCGTNIEQEIEFLFQSTEKS